MFSHSQPAEITLFMMQGLGFRVQGLGFRICGFGPKLTSPRRSVASHGGFQQLGAFFSRGSYTN